MCTKWEGNPTDGLKWPNTGKEDNHSKCLLEVAVMLFFKGMVSSTVIRNKAIVISGSQLGSRAYGTSYSTYS